MLVEGYGLQKVMITDGETSLMLGASRKVFMVSLGIVGEHATTNHIIETSAVLGIEAARINIINEIKFIMKEHGMSIDPRHVMLLGDVMTYKVINLLTYGKVNLDHSCLLRRERFSASLALVLQR